MKKFVACVAVMLLLTAGASKDKALAIVNNEVILESEFIPMLEEYKPYFPPSETVQKENELKDFVLDTKINEVILKQEAKKQKIKSSKEETQKVVSKFEKNFTNESEFLAQLKKQNMTITDLEKKISEQIVIKKLLKQNLEHKIHVPSDSELRTFYEKVVAKMKISDNIPASSREDAVVLNFAMELKRESSEQVRVRQIFINLPKDANEESVKAAQAKVETIKKELKKHTFADVARQYSDDPTSKEGNENLGVIARGDSPEMDKVFSIKVGDYTREPIRIDLGFLFLKIEEKHAKKDIAFDDVKDMIFKNLIELNTHIAQEAYIEELKSKTSIKTNKTW